MSAGADARHSEHILEEHGMSCLRYSSRTIFCTFPLFVVLTKTFEEIFEAWPAVSADRLRLVIAF